MTGIRFIAGSGRSGTTWILDALAAANGLRPIFEPLHPYVSEAGRRYAHRALSADEEHSELQVFLVGVCAGSGPRLWTQYRQQRRWLLPPAEQFWSKKDAGRTKRHWIKFLREMPQMTWNGLRQRPLVKCIRANLMLPWVLRHLQSRVVLIVRHPGAVVESEIRGRWNANFALDRFRGDQKLHELTDGRYLSLLNRPLKPVEALAMRWIIENQWVMETASAHGISIVHYEHLRSASERAWPTLCEALAIPSIPSEETLTKPSQQSAVGRTFVSIAQPKRPRWMNNLAPEHRDEIQGVLEAVEFDGYIMNDPEPRHSGKSAALTGHKTVTA